jgi:two-component system response regulator DevR
MHMRRFQQSRALPPSAWHAPGSAEWWCSQRLFARRFRRNRPDASLEGKGANRRIRLLIVDDHAVFREGIRALFDLYPDIDVVAEAASASEAISRACAVQPDIVLMDVRLSDGSGAMACRAIRARAPEIAVLMLSAYSDGDALFAAIEGGAAGYVLKHARTTEVVNAIRRVANGDSYLDPAVAPRVLARIRQAEPNEDERLSRLTPTERRILALLANGLTNRRIGMRLGYAESTVKNYVSKILAKLEVSRRTEAAAYLVNHGKPS